MAQIFLPNLEDVTGLPDQAYPDAVDFQALLSGYELTGVVSGCAITEDPATPDMTVDVASGSIRIAGVVVSVTAQANNVIAAADAINLRIDLVSINNSGTVVVTSGVAQSSPVAPSIPANSVAIAFVYVPANDTVITNDQVVDKRVSIVDATLTTKGDLLGYNTNDARVPVGANDQVLTADSTQVLGVKWAAGGGTNTLIETNQTTGEVSGSAYAIKGNFIRPRDAMNIHALIYFGDVILSATYRAYVMTYSGTTVTTVIGSSGSVVAGADDVGSSGSPTIRLPFSTPISLTADVQYLIALGRTDGGDTYGLPIHYPNELGGHSFSKYLPIGSGRIAKQAPTGGDTIDVVTTAVVRMGVEWEYV